jgi:hypothetical protein
LRTCIRIQRISLSSTMGSHYIQNMGPMSFALSKIHIIEKRNGAAL